MKRNKGKRAHGLAAGGAQGQGGLTASPRHVHSTGRDGERQPGTAVFNALGRVVGRIDAEGWLVKTGLDPKLHQLHTPPAWATDAAHMELPIRGLRLFTQSGEVWEARRELWERYGFAVVRGHGEQLALPLRYWRVSRGSGPEQLKLL